MLTRTAAIVLMTLTSLLPLIGQEPSPDEVQAFNQRFEQYVESISTQEGKEDLIKLLNRIKRKFKEDETGYQRFVSSTFYNGVVRWSPLFWINFNNRIGNKEIPKEFFSMKDIRTLRKHAELLDLIVQQVYQEDGKTIKNDEDFLKQWNFYDIKSGDVIADIGAGTGADLSLLSFLDKDLDLTVTELRKFYLRFARKKSERFVNMGYPEIKVVEAAEEETNLPANHFDKIILKNTLHHFSEPTKMFASITKTLNERGILYVCEGIQIPNEIRCTKKMTAKAVRALIEKNDYIILDQMVIGEGVYFSCVPKSKIQWQ